MAGRQVWSAESVWDPFVYFAIVESSLTTVA
jgi:hypothetical protein